MSSRPILYLNNIWNQNEEIGFFGESLNHFEDITYGDSCGRHFLALPDGSYYTSIDGKGTVWGEAYEIADGEMRLICEEGEYESYAPETHDRLSES